MSASLYMDVGECELLNEPSFPPSLSCNSNSLWAHVPGMGIDDDMIEAAENGKLAEVQRLVGRGANVNAKDYVCSRLNT